MNTTVPVTPEPAKTGAPPEPVKTAPVLDAVKQQRYAEADKALAAHQKEVSDKAAAEAVAAKAAEAAKQAEADQVANLTTKLTEAQTQASTLQERAQLAEKLEAVSALAKAGKHYEAMQLVKEVTGADMDQAVQDLINPGASAGSAPKPDQSKAKAEEEPENVKALREQVEALTKRLADADKYQADQMKEAGRRTIVARVNEGKAEFPFLSSNEAWINQALVDAEQDYGKAVEANKGQDLTPDQKNELIDKALKLAESKHKTEAENYAKILGLTVKTPTVVVTPKPDPKPTLTYTGTGPGQLPALPQGKAKSLDELKRARRSAN